MSETITVGLNLAKNAFQVHGNDSKGSAALFKKLRRAQVIEFLAKLPPCLVAMEVCRWSITACVGSPGFAGLSLK